MSWLLREWSLSLHSGGGRRAGIHGHKLKQKKFSLDKRKNVFPSEGSEVQEVAQRLCAVSVHPWGFERPDWIKT